MNIKILFKDYGKGKERIILVNTADNMAFLSFGKKNPEWGYFKEQYDKDQAYLNRYQDLNKEQLNALHYDLSYDLAHTSNFIRQIELGREMAIITKIFKDKE